MAKKVAALTPAPSEHLAHAISLLDDEQQLVKFMRKLGREDKPALDAMLEEGTNSWQLDSDQREKFTAAMRQYAGELQKNAMVNLQGPPVQSNNPERDQWVEQQRPILREKKKFPTRFEKSGDDIAFVAPDEITSSVQMMVNTGQVDYHAASIVMTQITRAQPWSKDADSCSGTAGMLAGLEPQDPLEGLLCAQMTMAHNLAAEFARRALNSNDPDIVDKHVNRTTKLMNAFTRQVEVLNKHRNKGQQQIIVKHQQVNVAPGGQAVVGDINQGRE